MRIETTRATSAGQAGRDRIVEIHLKNIRDFQGPRLGKVLTAISQAAAGRLLPPPIPLQSGGLYLFFQTNQDPNALANKLDLGQIESVDVPGRKITIVLDESKVPE
jgi:hypothetical protein